jgi:hypothetical protein
MLQGRPKTYRTALQLAVIGVELLYGRTAGGGDRVGV